MTIAEWRKEVEEHYADEKQLARIDVVVNFIHDHCLRSENTRATFSGVWGYLDIQEQFDQEFLSRLESLMVNGKKVVVTYNQNPYDIIIEWGE